MAMKLIDETGNKYGFLTVKELTKDKNNRTAWLCQCDCGNTKIVRGSDLRTGRITSCGKDCKLRYKRSGVVKNEVGNRYGRLTVLYRNGSTQSGKALWHCKCDCGNEVDVVGSDLRNERILSCGCYNKEINSERQFKDEIGNKYGKLTVVELITKHPKALWKCKCDCGNFIEVYGCDLRSGNTKSCGCLKSYYEVEISQYLTKLNVDFKKEYSFDDLTSLKGTKLRFDFAIFKENKLLCLIEYNGEQHYKPVDFYGGEEGFLNQQYNDNLKIDYCKNHNIPLFILNKDNDIQSDITKIITNMWGE